MRDLEDRLIVCLSIGKGDVPRTAWGQCVKRFIRGYSVTNDNEEAPSSMLEEVSETTKQNIYRRDSPVPVQLQQNTQSCGKLSAKEHKCLSLS